MCFDHQVSFIEAGVHFEGGNWYIMYLNRCCVLPLLAVVSVCAAFKSELDSHWIAYKSLYEKGYSTDEEADHRAMFEQNINFVNSQNLREDVGLQSYRLGLNQFSDMV